MYMCDTTPSYVGHDCMAHDIVCRECVTWLVHVFCYMRDITHLYMWQRLLHMWVMTVWPITSYFVTPSCAWRDSFICFIMCVTWLINRMNEWLVHVFCYMRDITHLHMWWRLLHTWVMTLWPITSYFVTPSCAWSDLFICVFICVTWLINRCDTPPSCYMAHSYMSSYAWHDSCIRVIRPLRTCAMTLRPITSYFVNESLHAHEELLSHT